MGKKGKSGHLDQRFVLKMDEMLGSESRSLIAALESEPPTSVFINMGKDPGLLPWSSQSVPWCSGGMYLEERPAFIFDPLFHAGCYYVMEASSMFLQHVIGSLHHSPEPVRALDLCAAPGGKSVVALSALPGGSVLVCNEVNKSRFQTLQYNCDKWGAPNVVRTSLDPSRIPWSTTFDLILVDAPCSGEGLFRKDKGARDEWSPESIGHCSSRQRRILTEADRLIASGGTMIYSTCTFNEEENIRQVKWLAEQFGYESVSVQIQDNWNISRVTLGQLVGYQFYPHKVKGEGFFCAVLRKTGKPQSANTNPRRISYQQGAAFKVSGIKGDLEGWIKPVEKAGDLKMFESLQGKRYFLQTSVDVTWLLSVRGTIPGTAIGDNNEGIYTPSYPLALSQCLHPNVPAIELSREQAIAYLRKEQVDTQGHMAGWHVARYEGFALGWLKQTQAGLKNYFPSHFRIIKQPPSASAKPTWRSQDN